MRALLAALLLLAAAGPASAEFRYVPPPADTVASEPVWNEPAAEGAGGATAAGASSEPGPAVWRVEAGETLRAVLARWGARAGTDVLFLTDRRYRLDGTAAFEGGFMDAVQALFRRLSHLPHAPVAARSEGGTGLVVRHRSPHLPEEGDEP